MLGASNSADVPLLVLFARSIANESDTTDEPRTRGPRVTEGQEEGGEGTQLTQWTHEVLESWSLKANIIMERSRTRRANGSRIQSGQSA